MILLVIRFVSPRVDARVFALASSEFFAILPTLSIILFATGNTMGAKSEMIGSMYRPLKAGISVEPTVGSIPEYLYACCQFRRVVIRLCPVVSCGCKVCVLLAPTQVLRHPYC